MGAFNYIHRCPDENGKFYKRLRERFLEHFES